MAKSSTLFLVHVVFLLACSGTNSNKDQGSIDSAALAKDSSGSVSTIATTPAVIPTTTSSTQVIDGILMNETALYKDTVGNESVDAFSAGPVQIIGKSGLLVPNSNAGNCAGYYWYEIKTEAGKSGWVKGIDLHEKASGLSDYWHFDKSILDQAIAYNGKNYFLQGAVEMSMDLSGNEYIGCPVDMIPFLYDEAGTIYPIAFNSKDYPDGPGFVQNNEAGNLTITLSSEGGDASIESLGMSKIEGDEAIVFNMNHSYQEGGDKSQLFIMKGDNGFVVAAFMKTK